MTARRSASASARSTTTFARDSSAAFTSNDGFSVVAPISMTVPASTCGSSASCCALLKRWISSTNSTVRSPRWSRRVAASATASRSSLTPAMHRRQRHEARAAPPPPAGAPASSSRCPAAPTGSATAAPSPRAPRRSSLPRPEQRAPARRTRPASAAASARPAAAPGDPSPRRARTGPRGAVYPRRFLLAARRRRCRVVALQRQKRGLRRGC